MSQPAVVRVPLLRANVPGKVSVTASCTVVSSATVQFCLYIRMLERTTYMISPTLAILYVFVALCHSHRVTEAEETKIITEWLLSTAFSSAGRRDDGVTEAERDYVRQWCWMVLQPAHNEEPLSRDDQVKK